MSVATAEAFGSTSVADFATPVAIDVARAVVVAAVVVVAARVVVVAADI